MWKPSCIIELHYKEILPNVNVICRMQGMMFKDDIVMENPQAQHRFVLEMDTQNVQLVKQEEGTIVAYAEGNARTFPINTKGSYTGV